MLRWMLGGICLGFAAARDFLFVAEMGFQCRDAGGAFAQCVFWGSARAKFIWFQGGERCWGLSTWD